MTKTTKLTKWHIKMMVKLMKTDLRTKKGKEFKKKYFSQRVTRKYVIEQKREIKEEVEKKFFRSLFILSIEDYPETSKDTDVRCEVWIYTKGNTSDVTETELRNKMDELISQYPIPSQLRSRLHEEFEGPNEEIDEDEVKDEIGVWQGKLVITYNGVPYPRPSGIRTTLGSRM